MATSIITLTPAALSGIGVPDEWEYDADASTLGQTSPIAGRPTTSQDAMGRTPALTLSATGAQTATTTISVLTASPGSVGKAGYRYRHTVSGATDAYWRGADAPAHLDGAAFQGWSAVVDQAEPHAVTLPDDTQVSVYRQTNGVARDIKAQVVSTSSVFASAVTVRATLDASHVCSPCVFLMRDPAGGPDPLLMCAYWVADDTANEAQVDISYSRDGGTTWALWAVGVLNTGVRLNSSSPFYVLGRLRVAQVGASLALFAHVTDDSGTPQEHIWQYASGDAGQSFTKIGAMDECGYPDIAVIGVSAYLAYIVRSGTSAVAILQPLGSPWVLAQVDDLTDDVHFMFDLTDAATVSGVLFTFGAMSICATRTGQILSTLIRPSGTTKLGYAGLFDPGTGVFQWWLNGTSSGVGGYWWNDGLATSTEYPQEIAVTEWRGQARVYANMASTTTTYDNRITQLRLGGNSTVTMPRTNTPLSPRYGWAGTMLPTSLASVYGATFTGAGTRSITTNVGWETLTTTANTAYYTQAPTATAAQQIWRLWRFKVDSGGAVSARVVACGIRAAGVGYGFEVEARPSTTQIRLRDVNAAADLTTITIDTNTTGVDLLMAVSGSGLVTCFARVVGTDEDRYWYPIENGYQLTDDAGGGGTANVVMWGGRASGTTVSRWILLGGNEGAQLGVADLAGGFTNPDDLRAAPYAASGAYVGAGVSIGATGGPALVADAYSIPPDSEHPARYLLPLGSSTSAATLRGGQRASSRDPAAGWRALNTSGYLWFRAPELANRYMRPVMYVHTEGVSAKDPAIVAYNYDTAGVSTLGTLTNSASGLRYIRASATSCTVRVDLGGASTSEPFLTPEYIKGGWWHFGTSYSRPIVDVTVSRFSDDEDAAVAIITLSGITGAEATSGTNGVIIYPRATFVFASAEGTEYGKIGLYWSAPPLIYDAEIRGQVVSIGGLEPLRYLKAWGTAYRRGDPAERTEFRSGITIGTKVKIAAPTTLTIPMTAFRDQEPLVDPTTAHRRVYRAYNDSGYYIAGVLGDEPAKLLGAWERAGGSQHPVVWIPRFSTAAPTSSLVGQNVGFYATMTSPPVFTDDFGRDTGNAWACVLRGDNLTLEEKL